MEKGHFQISRLAAVTRCLFNGEIENSREANSLYRMLTVALYSLCFAARSDPASLSSFLSLLTGCPLPPPTLPLQNHRETQVIDLKS